MASILSGRLFEGKRSGFHLRRLGLAAHRHVPDGFETTAPERAAMMALVDAAKARLDAEFHPDGYNRFLMPFRFIRAGSPVSLPALVAAPLGFVVLLLAKMGAKLAGVYPATLYYKSPRPKAWGRLVRIDGSSMRMR